MLSKIKDITLNWAGVLLALLSAIATLWLTLTNKLDLYIHPRYIVFSAVLATILLLGIVVAVWLKPGFASVKSHPLRIYWTLGLLILAIFMLIVLRPATLTTASVVQRGINSSGTVPTDILPAQENLFKNNDYTRLSIRDWASLLNQTDDPSFFAGKTASLVGFISADTKEPDTVFYVSRFIISCCAVDAQPVGVPVYMPGWKNKYAENQWVRVVGSFTSRQYYAPNVPATISPDTVEVIKEPEDPYVY